MKLPYVVYHHQLIPEQFAIIRLALKIGKHRLEFDFLMAPHVSTKKKLEENARYKSPAILIIY